MSIEKIITIKEKRVTTTAYVHQGLDLNIKQTREGKDVFINHLNSPGLSFYGTLLKFLFVHEIPIPTINKPKNFVHNTFQREAKDTAKLIAFKKFPIEYEYHPRCFAEAQPIYSSGEPPEIEFKVDNGSIALSVETTQELLKKIPTLYP
ncbi:MAG: hypothetical protein ABH821_03850 [archaeon]